MEAIDKRIIRMLKKHHIFTLATSSQNHPWCATCFYVYHEESNRIIFTSEKHTRHIAEGIAQTEVSGAIALETRMIGKIRGIQFSGTLAEMTGEDYTHAVKHYLKRFPYAAPYLKDTAVWAIAPAHLKMTDNRLGFGKKIIWYEKPDLQI
jgi:uncharacterized protein